MDKSTTKQYYKIIFPDNTCYIGKTGSIRDRKYQHHSDVRLGKHDNKHIQEVYNKYGYDNWEYKILFEEKGDKEYHRKREYKLIQETPNTLNLDDGRWIFLSKDEVNKYNKKYNPRNDETRRRDREYARLKRSNMSNKGK